MTTWNNDYGITKGRGQVNEWKAFKKTLKQIDKADDTIKFSRSDYKEIKKAIENNSLGSYMEILNAKSAEMKHALGLALGKSKVVDGTEKFAEIKSLNGIEQAEAIIADTKLYKADKAKVMQYILDAYQQNTVKNVTEQDKKTTDDLTYASSSLAFLKPLEELPEFELNV